MLRGSPRARETRLEGIGVCQGVAIGSAFLVDDPRGRLVRMCLPTDEVPGEIARFRHAVRIAQQQIEEVRKRMRAALGEEQSYILEPHLLMLQDRSLGRQIEQFINDNRANAEWAVREVASRFISAYTQIADSYLRERSNDVEDVARRLISILSGTKVRDLNHLASDAIIVAEDLLPSVAAELDPKRILGFITTAGGSTSHTAIIARSLGIPAVVGVRELSGSIRSGETIIIDGSTGVVILRPSPETLLFYNEQRLREQEQKLHFLDERELPAVTSDGEVVALRANIELLEEIDAIHRSNAAGVGLYRSEYLYAQSAFGLPTEDDQYKVYRMLAEMSGEDGAVIRTFDLGGDKLHLSGFKAEPNPALGLRAIRLSMQIEEVFRTQLRAILRAAEHGRLKIVLPLITNLDELRTAKRIIAEVEREMRAKGIKHAEDIEIGVMVEVPSAVLQAEAIAREADFLSLGTNDLTQYMLAVDRTNESVSHLFDPLHPAVLRAIKFAADAARRARIAITVCGEMASNPVQVVVLLGLGLRDLSMTPNAIPAIKRVIRAIDLATAEKIAARALALTTPAEVNHYVREQVGAHWAHFLHTGLSHESMADLNFQR
ncbi:MAG: phosphoenolpyruvate--protein phosphotransferase [Acidobacteria bacterium]|nr:phosphoenolpyruvate--protein phosphotransferase [Acidobacteriota bacterium]